MDEKKENETKLVEASGKPPVDFGKVVAGMNTADKLGAIGAILVAIATFLPYVRLIPFRISVTMSKGLMMAFLIVVALAGFCLYRKTSEALAPIGTGVLIVALMGYFSGLSHVDGIGSKMGYGIYVLLTGTILLIVSGIYGKFRQKGEAFSTGGMFGVWKESLTEPVHMGFVSVPGWMLAAAVVAWLVVIAWMAGTWTGTK